MTSQLHSDPTRMMNPAERQQLANAQAAPIGTLQDATGELESLEQVGARSRANIRKAGETFRSETSIPDGTPDDAAQQVREAAESSIAGVETSARRELAIAVARARSVVSQLEAAASEPDLSAVPSDVLDGATRYLPLVESQLRGASLGDIAKRLKSAVIRDDQSELLALSMALAPILAGHRANPDDAGDSLEIYDLKASLRQITSRWRSRSLDASLIHARTVERQLSDLDHGIMAGFQARTGDADPYGFLDGQRAG